MDEKLRGVQIIDASLGSQPPPLPSPLFQSQPINQQHRNNVAKKTINLKNFIHLNLIVVLLILIILVTHSSYEPSSKPARVVGTIKIVYFLELIMILQFIISFSMFYTRNIAKVIYRFFVIAISIFALVTEIFIILELQDARTIICFFIGLLIPTLAYIYPIDHGSNQAYCFGRQYILDLYRRIVLK